jgi:ribokinase
LAVAKELGKLVATDVHALRSLDDTYNQDFMAAADILFLSDESLDDTPQQIIRRIFKQFDAQIVVIGMGAEGAMMGVRRDGFVGPFPAVRTRNVVNSIGAGDALFSAFIDRFQRLHDPYTALRQAMVFASYKIGEKGAAQGFLSAEALDEWVEKLK